ncbi:hypothetical protein [Mycolicibacterium holsaticum]|uniref:hypothetical protein n=1 Tax=Mycolicibacterium holsaticum TaxID=152142 RepID=UPI000AFCA706|nr:hypothetical protein [Mycolicibacterium holsaticum]
MAIGEYWPDISETAIQDVAEEQRAAATRFSTYGETLHQKVTKSPDLLEGQSGIARVQRLKKMRNHAYDASDQLESTAVTAESYKSTVVGLKMDLERIGDAAQEAWESAQKSKVAFSVAPYKAEAATVFSTALGDIASAPAPLPGPVEDGSAAPVDHKTQKDERTTEKEDAGAEEKANTPDESASGQVDKNISEASMLDGSTPDIESTGQADAPITEAPAQTVPDPAIAAMSPVLGAPTTGSPGMPTSGASSAGSGLGAIRPPQMPSGLNALGGNSLKDAATAPASSMSEAFSSSSPLSSAASSFQSGLASGMGASGAVSPTSTPPLEKFAAQHPSVASVGAPGPQGPVVPAQATTAPAPSATPHVGGGGGGMAPMVPPAGGGGGLAPYVPPGGGGAAVPPAGAGTVPSAAQSAPPPVAQPSQQGGGGGAPLVAGSSGAGVGAVLPEAEPSAELVLARRVLDGLVRGTEVREDLLNGGFVQWAVSVVHLPSGPSVSIASSAGGGAYVPPGVFIPNSAHLAVFDELLPQSWASRFMGVEQPTAVLAAHAEELSRHVPGARWSALVTTELGVARPAGWPEFETVRAVDILHTPGEAPGVGGGYVHRLMTVDVPAWQKVQTVLQQGLGLQAAGTITEGVLAAAAATHSPMTGVHGQVRLIEQYDVDHVLEPLRSRTAVDWDAHHHNVLQRHNSAVLHPSMAGAVLDADDSEVSQASRQVYAHFYRAGLMIELLRCWREQPPSLPDIVYCAKIAGFGHVVDAVLAPPQQQR